MDYQSTVKKERKKKWTCYFLMHKHVCWGALQHRCVIPYCTCVLGCNCVCFLSAYKGFFTIFYGIIYNRPLLTLRKGNPDSCKNKTGVLSLPHPIQNFCFSLTYINKICHIFRELYMYGFFHIYPSPVFKVVTLTT